MTHNDLCQHGSGSLPFVERPGKLAQLLFVDQALKLVDPKLTLTSRSTAGFPCRRGRLGSFGLAARRDQFLPKGVAIQRTGSAVFGGCPNAVVAGDDDELFRGGIEADELFDPSVRVLLACRELDTNPVRGSSG